MVLWSKNTFDLNVIILLSLPSKFTLKIGHFWPFSPNNPFSTFKKWPVIWVDFFIG